MFPNRSGATLLAVVALLTVSSTSCSDFEPEQCGDGVDNDENGLTDCADVACATDPSCPAPHTVDVPFIAQQTQVWCWAACSEMVLASVGHDKPQCAILSGWYGVNCCVDYSACATTGSLDMMQTVLIVDGALNSVHESRPLTFAEIKSEIDQGRPVIAGYRGSFSGHVVVIHGYREPSRTLLIHDPYFGPFDGIPYGQSFTYNGGGGTLFWSDTIWQIGTFPPFCCTTSGKWLLAYNTTLPVGAPCTALDSNYQWRSGNACF